MMPGLLTVLLALVLAIAALLAPRPAPPLDGAVERIVIDKSERTLSLIQDGEEVRRYAVALGFAPTGAKERQGDGRTPEGTFLVDRRNDASRFHLSLGLDYPQAEDVARARAGGYFPGGDIFIHGQPEGVDGRMIVAGDWTDGCVAVSNASIEEIWAVTPLGTPVEIVP